MNIFGEIPKSSEDLGRLPDRDQFETTVQFAEKLSKRFEKPLCVGSAKFILYDIEKHIFPLKVEWKDWFAKLAWEIGELYLSITTEIAQELYNGTEDYFPIYVRLAVGKSERSIKYKNIEICIKYIFLSEIGKEFTVSQTTKKIHEEPNEEFPEPEDDENVAPFTEKDVFEKTEPFKERLQKIFEQPLHAGWVKLQRELYDADADIFKLKIQWNKWFLRHNFHTGELYINVKPVIALFLYKKAMQYPLYVRLVVGNNNHNHAYPISTGSSDSARFVSAFGPPDTLQKGGTGRRIKKEMPKHQTKSANLCQPDRHDNNLIGHISNINIVITSIGLSALETTFSVYQVADLRAWDKARTTNTTESYNAYLNMYGIKRYASQAHQYLKYCAYEDEDEESWVNTNREGSIDAFKKYLCRANSEKHKLEAQQKIKYFYKEKKKCKIILFIYGLVVIGVSAFISFCSGSNDLFGRIMAFVFLIIFLCACTEGFIRTCVAPIRKYNKKVK